MTLLFNRLTFTFKKDPCNRRTSTIEVAIAAEEGIELAITTLAGTGVVGGSS